MNTDCLPQYLRLIQIIGDPGLSPEQAEVNKQPALTRNGKPKFRHTRPRPAIPGILPISKTSLYEGIKRGIYPRPYHLGGSKTALWKTDELLAAIEKAAV